MFSVLPPRGARSVPRPAFEPDLVDLKRFQVRGSEGLDCVIQTDLRLFRPSNTCSPRLVAANGLN